MSKILLISHIFPPAVDGGSRVIYKLGQQFEARGHNTLYLSSNCSSTDDFVNKVSLIKGKAPQQWGKGFIKLPVYTYLRKPLKFLNLFIPKKFYLYHFIKVFQKGPIFKFIPFLKAIVKIIKFNPDLIVAGPLPTTIVIYAHFFKFITNALTHQHSKVLINASFHHTDPDFHQFPLIKALQKADYLWTLTEFETNYFVKNFKISINKIILAGNGVNPEFLIKKNKVKKSTIYDLKTTILFIGSLSAHKRVELLINSFSSLFTNKLINYSSIQLIIAGQKTLYYPIIKQTYDSLPLKIKNNIKFVFSFPQNKLVKLIDNCDFLVLPSIQESFGLVVIESWARGKPVIVSNIPSLSEIVSKSKGGLIFKKDNYTNLAQKMDILIKSPKLCIQYGQNGLKYVKNNYSWEKVSQLICQKVKLS